MFGSEAVAEELVRRISEIANELLATSKVDSLSEMELAVRRALVRLGRQMLESWLAKEGSGYAAGEIECSCGGQARYLARREGILLTALGAVRYKRAYYLCPQCHRGTYPLDERLGLRPGEVSAGLESLLGIVGAGLPFARGTELFERLTMVEASTQSVSNATEAMGEEVMKVEEEWKVASHDPRAIDAQEHTGEGEKRLYGALDAVKFHSRGKRTEEDNGWRDLKVGTWFLTDGTPPSEPDGEWEVRARDITYYCDIAEAEKFGELLWATGFQRAALRAKELVFVSDGAEWIWNLVTEHFPQAVQIVDWFHAAERLGDVAAAVFEQSEEKKAWLTRTRAWLWQGDVEGVIGACEGLAERKGSSEAIKAAGYFRKHQKRMAYGELRKKGYQIGSGTVESACKQVGIQRMKVPGATWSLEGARRTAKARAAWMSGQWDEVAARRKHLRKAA